MFKLIMIDRDMQILTVYPPRSLRKYGHLDKFLPRLWYNNYCSIALTTASLGLNHGPTEDTQRVKRLISSKTRWVVSPTLTLQEEAFCLLGLTARLSLPKLR